MAHRITADVATHTGGHVCKRLAVDVLAFDRMILKFVVIGKVSEVKPFAGGSSLSIRGKQCLLGPLPVLPTQILTNI